MSNQNKTIIEKYKLTGDSPYTIIGTRWRTLPELFTEFGYKVGAEIGVEFGRFSKCLVSRTPNLKLYAIDPWVAYANQFLRDDPEKIYNLAVDRLKPYNCEIVRKFSMDAVKDFEDESLDFVYIDGNHDFEHTTEDVSAWYKKVKRGGILAGHDYAVNKKEGCHVKTALHGWLESYDIGPLFIIKETRNLESRPSWFIVK